MYHTVCYNYIKTNHKFIIWSSFTRWFLQRIKENHQQHSLLHILWVLWKKKKNCVLILSFLFDQRVYIYTGQLQSIHLHGCTAPLCNEEIRKIFSHSSMLLYCNGNLQKAQIKAWFDVTNIAFSQNFSRKVGLTLKVDIRLKVETGVCL